MEENGNFLHLSGVLTDNPVYGHEVFGEKFYYATLSVPRLSGAEDLLPITVSERLMDDTPLTIGSKLALDGQLRSYNKVIEGAGRLLITGFAQHLVDPDSDENPNQVQLTGALCKLPSYRTTPFGREIADLMLAVNRAYGKSDYIPCITWGRTARFASHLKVGDKVKGRVVVMADYGAFVEIAPGHDGMVHISKLENHRVEKVEDVLNLGDMTWVKFMGFDEKGRANFSRKDALKEMANQ